MFETNAGVIVKSNDKLVVPLVLALAPVLYVTSLCGFVVKSKSTTNEFTNAVALVAMPVKLVPWNVVA